MSQLLNDISDVRTARDDLVERARAIQPILAKHAAEGDKTRQTNPESMQAIRDSGVFNVWVPRRFGGEQADLRSQLDILATIAEADPACAWIGALHTACTYSVSLFDDKAQEEVWADGTGVGICGGLTPTGQALKVEGGYRFTGSWMWMSGSQFAKWAFLSAPVIDNGEVVSAIFAVAPTSDLTLKDTWFTLGMRGTGSNTFVAEDLFVPEHRAIALVDETGAMNMQVRTVANRDEGLYKVPMGTIVATWTLGVPLGIARAALAEARKQLAKRSLSYTVYTSQREAVSTQLAIAKAATMIDAAYLLGCSACDDADSVIYNGTTLTDEDRARARQAGAQAGLMLREAVDLIVRTCGASSMADFNPLQRYFRDIMTLTLHALAIPDVQAENYGRALLGLDPTITMC